jgi:hypothetical protein
MSRPPGWSEAIVVAAMVAVAVCFWLVAGPHLL